MDRDTRRETGKHLREAAENLKASLGEIVVPGWGDRCVDDRDRRIQTAAEAIRVAAQTPHQHTRLEAQDLGVLIEHIAEILEQS